MQAEVAAYMAVDMVDELVSDESYYGAWGPAGDNFLHIMAAVIVVTDNAIDVDATVGSDTIVDVDTLISPYCKEFDGCFAKVVQMSCLPNSVASSVTNSSQHLYCWITAGC